MREGHEIINIVPKPMVATPMKHTPIVLFFKAIKIQSYVIWELFL